MLQIPLHEYVDIIAAEAYLLRLVQHPNVIKIRESIIKEGRMVLIMEYAPFGDLVSVCSEHVNAPRLTMGQRMACHVLFQIALALEYMHSSYVAHRDIKPANIVMGADGVFKVSKAKRIVSSAVPCLISQPRYFYEGRLRMLLGS